MRGQPYNLDAEKAVLGCILTDSNCLNAAVRDIKSEDFYSPENSMIFETILCLHSNNKPVDIITVSDKCKDISLKLLSEIVDIGTAQNYKHYSRIIKEKSIRRKYITIANIIMEMAYSDEYDSMQDFKNDVQQKVDIDIEDFEKNESSIKSAVLRVWDSIDERYKNSNPESKFYGFSWMDKYTGGAHDTDLTILAARPSVGKTAFSIQIAMNLAKKHNHVAIFSLEMSQDQLTERLLSNVASIDSRKLRFSKSLSDSDFISIAEASNKISELPIEIFDNVYKIQDIRAICRKLKNQGKLDFVIIDYLQLCQTSKKVTGELEVISSLSRDFKLMAKEMRCPIWVLSQLTRANERDNRRPKLIDLRSSGAIEQDADNVFFLHDETYGKYEEKEFEMKTSLELIIAKQRNGQRDIWTEIDYYKATQRFYDQRRY